MEARGIIDKARAEMSKALECTISEVNKLLTAKASSELVENIQVELGEGVKMKILDIAMINVSDPLTITVQPWDKGILKNVQKAIQTANIGINPSIQGNFVRCPIPGLSLERRQELFKRAQSLGETGHISIRTARHTAMNSIKELEISKDELKRFEKEVQKVTDDFNKKITQHLVNKEIEWLPPTAVTTKKQKRKKNRRG